MVVTPITKLASITIIKGDNSPVTLRVFDPYVFLKFCGGKKGKVRPSEFSKLLGSRYTNADLQYGFCSLHSTWGFTMTIPNQTAAIHEHAWKYFEIHANQRMTVFNYFLAVSGAIAAGLATTLQGPPRFSSLGIALGGLLVLVSFVFWKLDQRVCFFIKRAENALAEVESAFPVVEAHLFMREPEATRLLAANSSWWSRPWSYKKAFQFVFFAMAFFGVAGVILSLLKFLGYISW